MRALSVLFALCAALAPSAWANETFPSKPVTLIVASGPGGGTDLFARALAVSYGEKLGQPVVVENVPGAGGIIGIQKLNNAKPDGHTLIIASGMEYEMQALATPSAKVRTTDLKALGNFGTQPMVLVARPGLGVTSMEGLVHLIQSKPGQLSIAAVGPGTVLQITSLMVQKAAGLEVIEVSYKGAGQLVSDLLSDSVDVAMLSAPTVQPLMRDKKVVALAVSEAQRSPVLPDVPALGELPVFKGIDTKIGYPLYASKHLPQPIADKLIKAAEEALQTPKLQEALSRMFVAPAKHFTPEDANQLRTSQWAQIQAALSGQAATK